MPAPNLPIRLAAFQWLSEQVAIHGDVLPRRPLLEQGFTYQNQRIPLVSAQGIFKPAVMDLPLTITTTAEGPYDDSFAGDDVLMYRYRGTNPNHHDNVGLKRCMAEQLPLIYFHGHVKNLYQPIWPVYIVGAHDESLTFEVRADQMLVAMTERSLGNAAESSLAYDTEQEHRRRYATALVRQRLHQASFRERVLSAYREHCALCRLKHRELLDAAHIVPDTDEWGSPEVRNGLSLCKIHHAAYDKNVLGVTPDYKVEIREDVLQEIDGPMLLHGLQEMHGAKLWVPRRDDFRPDRDRLAWRYERFRKAV